MFFDDEKQQLLSQKKAIEELSIRNEKIDQDLEALLKAHDIELRDLVAFLKSQKTASDELSSSSADAQEKSDNQIHAKSDSSKQSCRFEKTKNDRFVERHWLYVR